MVVQLKRLIHHQLALVQIPHQAGLVKPINKQHQALLERLMVGEDNRTMFNDLIFSWSRIDTSNFGPGMLLFNEFRSGFE